MKFAGPLLRREEESETGPDERENEGEGRGKTGERDGESERDRKPCVLEHLGWFMKKEKMHFSLTSF